MKVFLATLRRDLLVAIRTGSETLNPLVFLVLVGVIFALVLGNDHAARELTGIPVVWTTALFANMLALEGLFRREQDEGTLATILVANESALPATVAKLIAHWLLTGLPISVLAPLIGLGFGLSFETLGILSGTLLIGTPILTLVGAIGAALVVGLGRGGVLLTLLVLPLFVPVLLLGIGTCQQFQFNAEYIPPLLGLLAILSGAITAIPISIAPILRFSQDQ
ncbi:MAG: heme exporter protein CcmB [Gammaproteobacteria bacterium]|nr:heme exporter protein CcmB [Gammaproteobacteria bacterium]